MQFLKSVFHGKGGNTFHPLLGKITSKTKGFVEGIFAGKTTKNKPKVFEEGIAITPRSQKHNTGFQEFPHKKTNSPGFQDILLKSIDKKDLIGNIDTKTLSVTNRKIQKVHLAIPYNTHLYDINGLGIDTVKKGTLVNFDNESPILSIFDQKTGKYQAYAKIQSITSPQDSSHNTLEHTNGGYIRTAWLDGVIQRKDTTRTENPKTPTEGKTKKINFSGYVGPDGREIPEYLLKSVTINYFGTVIATKVDTELNSINQNIAITRKSIIEEVMGKNVPIKETSGYKRQQFYIQKRYTWKELSYTIASIKIHGDRVFEDPNIFQIMESIKSKSTWQTLVQRASYIHQQQKKGLIPKRTTH